MPKRVILPILNSAVSFAGAESLSAPQSIYIRKADEREFYLLHDEAQRYGFHPPKTDAFWLVKEGADSARNNSLSELATSMSFVLNYLGDGNALLIGSGFVLSTGVDSLKIDRRVELRPYPIDSEYHPSYQLSESMLENVGPLSDVVFSVIAKNEKVEFILNRFNLVFCRQDSFDKIVDAAICLESLIPYDGELSYRFALLHSLLFSNDINERSDAFGILKALYNARSSVVHGDVSSKSRKAAIKSALDNWSKVMAILKKSLLNYLFFVHKNNLEDWKQYLERISLGASVEFSSEVTSE